MGQKVNPKIFRISCGSQKHSSEWYAKTRADYERCIHEDIMIMMYLERCEIAAHVGDVRIERKMNGKEYAPHITLFAGRTVAVFGKKGKSLEKIQSNLEMILGKKPTISVSDIKKPDTSARLLAMNMARSIEKRQPYKRVVKMGMENAMRAGALGIKVNVAGRLNGAEIAREEVYKEGSMPLHTIRANIEQFTAEAITTYGVIGIKVWVYLKGKVTSGKF